MEELTGNGAACQAGAAVGARGVSPGGGRHAAIWPREVRPYWIFSSVQWLDRLPCRSPRFIGSKGVQIRPRETAGIKGLTPTLDLRAPHRAIRARVGPLAVSRGVVRG